MQRYIGISMISICALLLTIPGYAAPNKTPSEFTVPEFEDFLVGDVEGTGRVSGKVLAGTTWVADWRFETAGVCHATASNDSTAELCSNGGLWCSRDSRIVNDGIHRWHINSRHSLEGNGGALPFVGLSAELTLKNLAWKNPKGYDNNWDQSIVMKYVDGNAISFRWLVDSEVGFDFFQVETDSLGLSESRVDYDVDPSRQAEDFRNLVYGPQSGNTGLAVDVTGLPLTPPYGAGTHEVYLRFTADGGYADSDGNFNSAIDAALVIDNIAITGVGGYTEDFEDSTLHANIEFRNTAAAEPFGLWARLHKGITDNDFCTENLTCAWLFTDYITPTAGNADNDYGPGGYVIKNWIDNTITSPWVDLTGTLDAKATFMTFRIFGGQTFDNSKILMQYVIRSKVRLKDIEAPFDSVDTISHWGRGPSWLIVDAATFWATLRDDVTPAIHALSREVQVQLRVGDWQHVAGDPPPVPHEVGPGPFFDRVRIGRNVLLGPVITEGIDARSQAQDCFGSTINTTITGGGQHHTQSTSGNARFDGVHLSQGADLGSNSPGSPQLITGDSISIQVEDIRLANGITAVDFYGAIVDGPHAGKVPPGFNKTGITGDFFTVAADSVRQGVVSVILPNRYFVDLAQETDPVGDQGPYLRGGDRLVYFWHATDGLGATSTDPATVAPTAFDPTTVTVAAAEVATGGLLEMSALPSIEWDAGYLATIAGLGDGDIDPGPTQAQIDNSSQKHCILYVQQVTSRRRSGDLNRTHFMYTMDILGYQGRYDVYDITGYGNTNNQLFSRATVNQVGGYELIAFDTGRSRVLTMTDGSSTDSEKINMQLNFSNWLEQAPTLHSVPRATLWCLGENLVEGGHPNNVNFWGSLGMGITLDSPDQGAPVQASSPDVVGKLSNNWNPSGSTDWAGGLVGDAKLFTLDGGCPIARDYDGLGSDGSVLTSVYRVGGTEGDGAISIYKKPNNLSNAIVSSFGWFDIRPHSSSPSSANPGRDLMAAVFSAVLSETCGDSIATGIPPSQDLNAPRVTVLKQNVPNPFNPTTTIHFDLARAGQVRLRIFDVAGHLVRTLVDERMEAGRYRKPWNGLDHAGGRVSSGVYFYQLEATDYSATKKMVVLK